MPQPAEDLDEHDTTPWYEPGLHFSCAQCGNCCSGPSGYIWFEPEEGQAIADRLGISHETFTEQYTVLLEGRPSLAEKRVGGAYDCIFLERHEDGRKTCTIYDVRPTQCRTWPFWDSNLESPRDWLAAGRSCHGMRDGGWGPQAKGQFFPVDQIRVRLEENPEGL